MSTVSETDATPERVRVLGIVRDVSIPMIIRRGAYIDIPVNAIDGRDDSIVVRVHAGATARALAGALEELREKWSRS